MLLVFIKRNPKSKRRVKLYLKNRFFWRRNECIFINVTIHLFLFWIIHSNVYIFNSKEMKKIKAQTFFKSHPWSAFHDKCFFDLLKFECKYFFGRKILFMFFSQLKLKRAYLIFWGHFYQIKLHFITWATPPNWWCFCTFIIFLIFGK